MPRLFVLLSVIIITTTIIGPSNAWSPASLWRLGRGPRMRPVTPTNLCVLAERPLAAGAAESSRTPEERRRQEERSNHKKTVLKEQQQQQQQKSYRMYHAVPIYTDFNDVDLVSTAPDFFPFPDDGDVVSPYDAHERDFTFQMTQEDEVKTENGRSIRSSHSSLSSSSQTRTAAATQETTSTAYSEDVHTQLSYSQLEDLDEEVDSIFARHDNNNNNHNNNNNLRNLHIPQIHLPPRLVPNVGWEHHHRATTSFVHERLHRRRAANDEPPLLDKRLERGPLPSIRHRNSPLVSATPEWQRLELHKMDIEEEHLRDLLKDEERSQAMFVEHDGVYLDFSRQRANLKTLKLLQDLAKKQRLEERIQDMVTGKTINFTEKRAVLHTALRAKPDEKIFVDGENVVEDVHEVLNQIKTFTKDVRNGDIRGYTGKRLRNIISVGIGGSYLGPEFLHEVLKTEPDGVNSALGYNLRFLANVDPVDVERTCADLDPEETLIIIVSKTFTTAETMLNARTMRQWLWDFMGNDKEVVRKHVVACASVSATDKVKEFGIDTDNYFFRFWDWVGGRYSVCSAVGAVPISLMYGFDLFEQFLKVRLLF